MDSDFLKRILPTAWITLSVFMAGSLSVATKASAAVFAPGFDYTYEAFSGDLNGDGAVDLYVRSKASAYVPIAIDDIQVVVPIKALPKEFVLHGKTAQNPAWVKLQLTPSDRSAVSSWPAANVSLLTRDFNADGATDLSITGMSFRDLIFASNQKGSRSPIGHNSLSEDERLFLKTVGDWLIDPSTLERNRYKVVGVEPSTAIWSALFTTTTPTPQQISFAFSTFCNPGSTCGLSNTPPTDSCVRTVAKYDANGNYIGTGPEDVCQYSLHVWSYAPGTVTLAENEAFHQDAVAFIDAFEDILTGSVTSYPQLTATLSLASAYLGSSSPIGSSNQQCTDAPVTQQAAVGLGPLAIPVAICAAVTVMVIAAILTRAHDVVDPANETKMYSDGLAAGPMPHGHEREDEALDFNPDPFGDDCDPPPPSRTGKLRENYAVLKDTASWRRSDLNNQSIRYWGHRERIRLVEEKRDQLKKRYSDICHGDIEP